MMIVCSVRDSLAGFGTLAVYPNAAVAKRDFANFIRSAPDKLNNAYDFSLYQVGTYDLDTGLLESVPAERLICGADVLRANDANHVVDEVI